MPGRLEEAMRRKGLTAAYHLTTALGVTPSEPHHWMRDRVPGGYNLARICWLLDVSPFWLLGLPEPAADQREGIVKMTRTHLGDDDARALEMLGRLAPEQRRRVVDQMSGMVSILAEPPAAVAMPVRPGSQTLVRTDVADQISDVRAERAGRPTRGDAAARRKQPKR